MLFLWPVDQTEEENFSARQQNSYTQPMQGFKFRCYPTSARRWQRKLTRRVKGGSNRRKAARRIANLRRYEVDVRKNFAHQTSHALVADPRHLLFVFEALGVQRMTRESPRRNKVQTRASGSITMLVPKPGSTKES